MTHHLHLLCLQAELKKGKEEVQRLKATLLEQEAAVLQRDRQLADLRKELKEAVRKAEPPMQRDQAVQSMLVILQDQQTQVSFASCYSKLLILLPWANFVGHKYCMVWRHCLIRGGCREGQRQCLHVIRRYTEPTCLFLREFT